MYILIYEISYKNAYKYSNNVNWLLSDPKRVKDPGYAFVWDNTQMELRVRHQCRGKRNEIKLWALMFAVRNRVPASNGNNEDITPW